MNLLTLLITVLLMGCGQAPALPLQVAATTDITTPADAPINPVVAVSPVPQVSPVPAVSPTPSPLVSYTWQAHTQGNQICPALQAWNSATQMITLEWTQLAPIAENLSIVFLGSTITYYASVSVPNGKPIYQQFHDFPVTTTSGITCDVFFKTDSTGIASIQ